MAHKGRGTRGQEAPSHPMQDLRLFSLSTGISEEDLEQLDTVTTRRGTKATLPVPTSDPWQYYRRRREDNWGDFSTEAMDTD